MSIAGSLIAKWHCTGSSQILDFENKHYSPMEFNGVTESISTCPDSTWAGFPAVGVKLYWSLIGADKLVKHEKQEEQ